MDVRIVIDRREKLGLDGPGAAALKVSIRLAIDSPSERSQVRQAILHADRACHAARSLAVAVSIELEATHNGHPVQDGARGHRQGHQAP